MKFPDFIIIGAMKAGTTSLWYNLNKHPDIFVTNQNRNKGPALGGTEINYWSVNLNKGIHWYKSLFASDKLCGEKSPSYFHNNKAMRLIHENIPNVKIILCLRNPVDRAYSHYEMAKKNKVVTDPIKVSRYIVHIENNIVPYFKNVHICINERMRNDLNGELNSIYRFLGLDSHYLEEKTGLNYELHNTAMWVKEIDEQNFYKSWRGTYKPLKDRTKLLSYFRPFNKRLFKYLGYEVKEWDN